MKTLKFSVFGHLYLLKRNDHQWLMYDGMSDGVKPLVKDVRIPAELAESEISFYLADLYQQQASDSYPDVYQI